MYYKGSMVSLFYATYNTARSNAVRTFMVFQRERSTSTWTLRRRAAYHRELHVRDVETLSYRQVFTPRTSSQ